METSHYTYFFPLNTRVSQKCGKETTPDISSYSLSSNLEENNDSHLFYLSGKSNMPQCSQILQCLLLSYMLGENAKNRMDSSQITATFYYPCL